MITKSKKQKKQHITHLFLYKYHHHSFYFLTLDQLNLLNDFFFLPVGQSKVGLEEW